MRAEIVTDPLLYRFSPPAFVIVAPLFNLVSRSTVFPPSLLRASYRFSWGEVQRYFFETLRAKEPPMHHYSEMVDDDYVSFVGCGAASQSWFLRHLSGIGALQSIHAGAALVVVQDDWRIEPPDRRQLRAISAFLIAPLMRLHKIPINRVVSLDSVLLPGAAELSSVQDDPLMRFDLSPSKYYDHNQLTFTLREYVK